MARTTHKELLDAGVHFGHLKRKWNPNMSPYIFMERNGIHIIDLHKTVAKIEEAASALRQMAKSGKKIMFVATKKQAKDLVARKVEEINMPFVTERWPGGMLTNFATIRRAIRKMKSIEKMEADGTFENMAKRERLLLTRQKAKLEKLLGSIADMNRLPAALFIVDIRKEHIAVEEARKLNIPTFAIVDTNSDPTLVDFPIPANDDASQSIEKIVDIMIGAIKEGLSTRKEEREQAAAEAKRAEEKKAAKKEAEEEKQKAEAETEGASKPEAKKVEEKKPEAKKAEAKKPEEKKAEAKKPEAKKPEAKKKSASKKESTSEESK